MELPSRTLSSAVVVAMLLILTAVSAQAAPKASDLVTPARAESVRTSPDGQRIAFTMTQFPTNPSSRDQRQTAIFVTALADTKDAERITPWGRRVEQPRWHPDSNRLVFVMAGTDGSAQLYLWEPDAEGTSALTAFEGGPDVNDPAWSPDGEKIAFTGRESRAKSLTEAGTPIIPEERQQSSRLWVMPAAGGEPYAVTAAALDIDAFTWAPDGERLAVLVIAGLDAQERQGWPQPATLATVSIEGDGIRPLTRHARGYGSRDRTLDWSPDGTSILFANQPGKAPRNTPAVIPAEGGDITPLLVDYPGHVMRARWHGGSDAILAQAFRGLQSRLLRIDADTGEVAELTRFNHEYPTFSQSRDGKTIAYIGHETSAADNVWRYRANGNDRRLTDLSPELRELALGDVQRFEWRNEQAGVDLQGVLVTPTGARHDAPYPLLVNPHGGPHTHYADGWHGGWPQFLAPRGYAVFLPNPRGSTGRDWDFVESIQCCLGDPDGDDVLTGVDALIERGIADPKRLYIGGASYAGFLTNWLLTKTDRFRAAVVFAGISDFVSFAGTAGLGEAWSQAFFPGSVQHRMASYEDRSPIRYLHRVNTPTLILHGEDDGKIPASQARQLYHGLQALGVESQLVIYPRAGHVLSEYGQQTDALLRVLGWFETH